MTGSRLSDPKLSKSRQKGRLMLGEVYPSLPILDLGEKLEDSSRGVVERIAQSHVDFILHFSPGEPEDEILSLPTEYGVWRYRFGEITSTPESFWDVYQDHRVTPVVLELLQRPPDPPIALWSGQFRTVRTSYMRNLDQILSGSRDWPAKVCLQIQNGFTRWEDTDNKQSSITPLVKPYPRKYQLMLLSLKTAKRRAEAALRTAFRYTTWNVGIVESPIEMFLKDDFKPNVQWIPQARNGHIQADPFGRVRNGKLQILFERLDYLHRKGVICAIDMDDRNPSRAPSVAIEETVHMSYPYIFEDQGQTYCIPETNQAREVSVYRAIEFPSKWEKAGTRLLSGIRAIDTTIFQYNGRWWLTFTDRDGGGDASLYIWYAETVQGPWQAHILNPVKTDVRSARPGGTPFEHNGKFYRPAQDCSWTGGGQIVINRIDELTPTSFREVPVATIAAFKDSKYKAGMHTLSAAGNYTLVDGKRFRFVPSGLLTNIAKGFGRLKGRLPTQNRPGQ